MSQNYKNLYQEITNELKNNSNSKKAEQDKIYHKRKGYKAYGLNIPQVKKVFKNFKTRIKNLNLKEKFYLAKLFYKSGYAENGRIGNAILALNLKEIKPEYFSTINSLLNHFNNWDETDDFSLNIMQPLLRQFPKETLKLLKKWNKSNNLWKRRASLVSFTRKAGESGKFTDKILNLCNNLIEDKEDLVQKAVGWVLKDAMRGEKRKVIAYVKKLRRKGVSSTITLYAIRDLKDKDRQEVLSVKYKKL